MRHAGGKGCEKMTNRDIANIESRFDSGAYAMRGMALVRGMGDLVYDADGKEYIDCVSSHGSSNLGHCHPRVIEAIRRQAELMISCPKTFYNDRSAALKEALSGVAPAGLTNMFLVNSGTESVEAAMKLARSAAGGGRKNFVATIGGFHGRTMGALSLTWNKRYKEFCEPLVPGVKYARYGDAASLEQAIDENTAAVFLEPIQGESGVRIPPEGYLREVREICTRRGALLVLDEIQTGFGRTGLAFECLREKVTPDIMCVAKSMAAGLPIGAMLARSDLKFKPKEHGSTFGDNPLACAAGAAAIHAMVDEELPARAAAEGAKLMQSLKELEGNGKVREVRGRGLMIGIDLADAPGRYVNAAIEKGLLVFPAGETVIRVYPPLVVQRKTCERIREILGEVLA
ncbi:[LysW]-aminoadipate semialdehyde/glutamate semialdehyde transaminase [Candidatus Burarchaeum australiense]|nr:[LysW]-aminoadipate semialdehyde/glutamate semialdehyde transaminase [Candidatus Burarchaeum australiense]